MSERFGSDVREALPRLPRSLLVGGTDDPSRDDSVVAESRHLVCEIPGADHGLEFDGEPIRSIDSLKQVATAVADYVAALESDDGA